MTNTRFAAILGTSLLALAACTPAAPATDDAASSSSVDAMMQDDSSSSVDAMMDDDAKMEAVMMQDGKMMTLWEGGQTAMMEQDVTLENGTVVKLDGTTVSADGSSSMMVEGEGMAMDGAKMDAAAVAEWMAEFGDSSSSVEGMMEDDSSSEAL